MALTAPEKKEIETLVRKEIKDFIGTTTVKQFEDKFILDHKYPFIYFYHRFGFSYFQK